MQGSANLDEIVVAPADVARILSLYERGLCLQAYRASLEVGPLNRWAGPSAMLIAGRLAMNIGAPRLAFRLHLRAGRLHPDDFEVKYYYVRALARRGPLDALLQMEKDGDLEGAEDYLRADWLAFRAILLGQLRDFDAAEASIAAAERARPDWPWVVLERAHLLELEDRRAESLAVSRRALELRPWYRPAVQAVASTLQSLGRDEEAIELLTEASRRLENAPVEAQLGLLLFERRRYEESARAWDRVAELSPLMEKDGRRWLAGRRSDTSYKCGDASAASAYARESGEPFFLRLADRLDKAPPDAKQVELDVGFVQQHHQTCAPATLASIAGYWKKPADHLEVADAICYDGTPDHRERAWADASGWRAREFQVTWESAVALLDRGIPFTLTTIEVTSAHLQAVIGYDARRGTFLIRDPSFRHVGEVFADGLVERYASTGPRGMAMVPIEESARLDAIELPEAEIYDKLYRLQKALHVHDRDEAALAFADLEATAPDHRLTCQAGRILALYDFDGVRLLHFLDKLLVLYPGDQLLQLVKLSCLREHAKREDRLALLRSICDRRDADPVFRRQLAQELAVDAREQETVVRLLRRAMRLQPTNDVSIALLGNLAWDRREFERATTLYRYASCLDDKDEVHARSYFNAARCLGRTDEALALLRDRFDRYGAKSSQPARTLFRALAQLERTTEAFDVLDQALSRRPDNGELRLYAVERHVELGEFDRATEMLETARGSTRRSNWLRAAASTAATQAELPRSLELWREVAEIEPTAVDAHASIVKLLAETSSREAALAHARSVRDRFPFNYALQKLVVQWSRDDGHGESEPEVRRLVEGHPDDAWARRELALVLGEKGDLDAALVELELAERLEPDVISLHHVKAQLLLRLGRIEEARESLRRAIRIAVDDDHAIGELFATCESRAQRLETLAFVEAELARQVIFGDGLLAFQRLARFTLEPEELLQSLRRAWTARPDLWHTWSALARQLDAMEQGDEAAEIASKAIERFPLVPKLRLDLAAIEGSRGRRDAKVEQLKEALKIAPGWSVVCRELAQVYEEAGRYDDSRAVLERALAATPLDPLNHGYLADALWSLGEKEAAIEKVRRAIVLDPSYEWAWDALRRWSLDLGRPDETAEIARDLARRRGGDPSVWLSLARNLRGPETLDERLDAVRRAIELNPRLVEAHDRLAEQLAEAGRFEEARAAAAPAAFPEGIPHSLLGRRAWIEARAGDLPEAVGRMRSAIAQDQDYYWGWRQMVDWLQEGEPEALLEATNHIVRLAPTHPVGYGYRGEARLRLKDRDGAKRDYRRALELEPHYAFAALSLADLHTEDLEFESAENALAALEKAQGRTQVSLGRRIALEAARANQKAALASFVELCRTPGENGWIYEQSIAALKRKGWHSHAEWTLRQALDHPDVNPIVPQLWVSASTKRHDFNLLEAIARFAERPAVFEAALEAYLRDAGKARNALAVDAALRRFPGAIRSNTRLWGMAGFALTTLKSRNAQAVRHHADWRKRDDAAAWMLGNYVIALRQANRVAEALEASRRALTLEEDFTTSDHLGWLAIDAVIDGDPAEAERLIARIRDAKLEGTSAALRLMARTGVAMSALRGSALREAIRTLHGALGELQFGEEDRPALRVTLKRLLRAVARRNGGLYTRATTELRLTEAPVSMV